MAHNVIIPNEFKARYNKILGADNKRFLKYCMLPLRKSIRLNPIKNDPSDTLKRLKDYGWKLKPIPWYKYGYWVEKQDDEKLGNTLEHFMGYYYVQEASSMIPPVVLDPKPYETILDMSAAPGSKTSQMCEMMNNQGAIIANDLDAIRIKALRFNLEKLGCMNVAVTRMNGMDFVKAKIKFDKVLLDAPCSAEGTVRKDWKVLSRWSIKAIRSLSNIQKKLILAAYDVLKPNGVLVYSTCTLAPEENEEVIDYLLSQRPDAKIEPISLPGLKTRPGITEWENKQYNEQVKNIARVWPQDNDTEGFVIVKITKP